MEDVGETAGAGLLVQARARPEAPALTCDGETTSYGEFDDRARRVSHTLAARGVERGDRVVIMLPNSREWLEVLHGAGRLGAVVVPMNPKLKSDEISWIIADSGARLVVTDVQLPDGTAGDAGRLLVGGDYEQALAQAPPDGEVGEVGDAWPVTMAYTSGTTGRPKGVSFGEDDFRRSGAATAGLIGGMWGLGPHDVHLVAGPLHHMAPLMYANVHLALGAQVVVMRKFDAQECLRLVEAHGVTTTQMVPTHFSRILSRPPEVRDRYDVSSLRLVMHAGAPCPISVKRAAIDFFSPAEVWEYYGASEGGGTSITAKEWLEHPGSVGKPHPGNEFKIIDADADELPPGEVGHVYARTAHSSFRYHNDDDKTDVAYQGEWFTVGDLGYLDEDGYLYLSDRRTDLILSGGVNIYPREIEEVLHRHPEVVDCAVVGLSDEEWGQVVAAVVQTRPGGGLDEAGVIAWCREHLADFKSPRRVWLTDELPRSDAGKVRKHLLREQLETAER